MVKPDNSPPVAGSENPKPIVKRPLSITIIAWLFIVGGASAILQIISLIGHSMVIFSPAVFFVPLGIGLLRLRRTAHSWAMLVVLINWIVWVLVIIFGVFGSGDIPFDGEPLVGGERIVVGLAEAAIYGAVLAWITRALWKYGSLFKVA